MFAPATYKQISASFATLDTEDLDDFHFVQPAQPPDQATLVQRIAVYYRAAAPFLINVCGWQVLPPKWRVGLIALVQALDLLSSITPAPTDPSPATAAAAADTTPTDPSFKAGKDL